MQIINELRAINFIVYLIRYNVGLKIHLYFSIVKPFSCWLMAFGLI